MSMEVTGFQPLGVGTLKLTGRIPSPMVIVEPWLPGSAIVAVVRCITWIWLETALGRAAARTGSQGGGRASQGGGHASRM